MSQIYAVLLDICSIQKYIFTSNKLKENIGASQIVQEVYYEPLQKVVRGIYPSEQIDFNSWKKNPETCLIENNQSPFEVGYIGGGNAFLLFDSEDNAKKFISDWTRNLIALFPGLITAVAFGSVDLNQFSKSLGNLFRLLNQNKYTFIPQTLIPRHGITGICSYSGYSMESWYDAPDLAESDYMSTTTKSKMNAASRANEIISKKCKEILGDEYCFTDQLDELAQTKGEFNYISTVHIDGNDIGKRFQEMHTLSDIRKLSMSVAEETWNSFMAMIASIKSDFSKILEDLGFEGKNGSTPYPQKDGKKILPIRPIIIGGDDITFVCNGRYGIYFAKIYLEEFQLHKAHNDIPLSSCAGISITKTNHPFYRSYEIAEELCQNSKATRRESELGGSWLDFQISYGALSGNIHNIRDSQYKTPMGNLLMRPYILDEKKMESSFNLLVQNSKQLKADLPRSKIFELREVLGSGSLLGKKFIADIKARRRKTLPEIPNKMYQENLWEEGQTPYFDMIELLEFYPTFVLNSSKKGG